MLASASALAMPKMPKHAHPVPQIWKWECDPGYVQSRNECEKVKIPRHGVLTPDGHGWDCRPGWEKSRNECQKVKEK